MKIEKKTAIAIVLGLVAFGVVVYQLRGVFLPSKTTTATASPMLKSPSVLSFTSSAPQAPQPEIAAGDLEPAPAQKYKLYIAELMEADIVFDNRGFRNPMTPLAREGSGNKRKVSGPATKVVSPRTEALALGYTVEGIVWNDLGPLALVNSQVVGIGEALEDGAVITEITRDTVRFSKDGNRYYLVLREE